MTVTKNTRWFFYLALLAGLASVGTHLYLSIHYFELHLGLTSGSAICNINSTFNCDTVSASKYATLFNIPISVWGLSTQLILVLFTLIYGLGLSSDDQRMGRYTFYASALVTTTSIIMGSLSLFFLKSYCLFCMLAYFLSFIQFFCLWKLNNSSLASNFTGDFKHAFTQGRWIGITSISIIPLVFLFNNMFLDHFGGTLLLESVESSFLSWKESTTQNNFTLNGLTKGPASSKMVVVEFADYLCPHCKHAAPTLKVFSDTHPDVKFIFKAFPLDGSCNADSKMPKGDGTRCLLTKTVFCAEKLAQKGWFFHETIFENQEKFYGGANAQEVLAPFVEKSGIDQKALESCRNSEEIHKMILDQSQEGSQAKIEGTPSIFVNGKLLSRGNMLPVLQKVYDSL
jgi:protein-disulfide isomerase/uncharacterized membrane protein